MPRWAKLCLLFSVAAAFARSEKITLFTDTFANLDQWVVEQMPGGKVTTRDGALVISDKGGCTVWFRPKLTAPVSISYDAVVRSTGRVSDLNCFWMATDPVDRGDLFHAKHGRTGAFATYDRLELYYVGYGGNTNTTTRFRRYTPDGARPLLPEHDLRDAEHLLKADHVYHIELIARDGEAKYIRDGETIFSFRDPAPLREGWFGFRTVNSEIEIRNFTVVRLSASPSVTER